MEYIRITKETMQTNYALFRDGQYITHSIQTDKKFLKLAGVE